MDTNGSRRPLKWSGDGIPWVVISDIDETIKTSSTVSVIKYMEHLFTSEPISGMPEVFQYIAMRLTPKFFYLSAGPSLLRYHFVSFISSHYPQGDVLLASLDFSISFLIDPKRALMDYKLDRIDFIFRVQEDCRVLCIGDDRQEDLGIYLRADESHPGWIHKIFIRDTGIWQSRVGTAGILSQLQDKVECFATAEELKLLIESYCDRK